MRARPGGGRRDRRGTAPLGTCRIDIRRPPTRIVGDPGKRRASASASLRTSRSSISTSRPRSSRIPRNKPRASGCEGQPAQNRSSILSLPSSFRSPIRARRWVTAAMRRFESRSRPGEQVAGPGTRSDSRAVTRAGGALDDRMTEDRLEPDTDSRGERQPGEVPLVANLHYLVHWPTQGGYNFVSGPLADITLDHGLRRHPVPLASEAQLPRPPLLAAGVAPPSGSRPSGVQEAPPGRSRACPPGRVRPRPGDSYRAGAGTAGPARRERPAGHARSTNKATSTRSRLSTTQAQRN